MLINIIQNNIERLLNEKKWRINEADRRIGSSRNIHQIMHGLSKNPGVNIMSAIAKAFDVEISELFLPVETQFRTGKKTNNKLFEDLSINKKTLLEIHEKLKLEIAQVDVDNWKGSNMLALYEELYLYMATTKNDNVDSMFIKWLLHKYS